jgi:putative ABC transport system substrate-binding protein
VLPTHVTYSRRTQVAELAVRNRLFIMYNRPDYVEAGGLMAYGVNLLDLDRRTATYVDKILKRDQARRSPRRTAEEV